jgi:indolepyruvate ferredoxin oxidoreductase alpha subunit
MKGRYQRFHMLNDALLQKKTEECCKIFKNEGLDDLGVGFIASGRCSSRVKNVSESLMIGSSLLQLGMPAPLPITAIRSFLKAHSKVFVVEESEPFIEDQIRVFGNVLGKRSGHLPFGNVTEADITYALKNVSSSFVSMSAEPLKRSLENPLYFCPDCVYVPFYDMMSAFKKEHNVSVTGDIGCSMYGAVMPYDVLDTALSLGAGIGIGSGVSEARHQKSVVVIGDFGFFHSGLLSLIESVNKNVPLLIFVMKNTMAAMTGGQPVLSPENIIQAILSQRRDMKNSYHCISLDAVNATAEMEKIKSLAAAELKKDGVSVIVLSWSCSKHKK